MMPFSKPDQSHLYKMYWAIVILVVVAASVTACGSATPTRVPPSPTSVVVVPTAPAQPTTPPTATLPVTPTLVISGTVAITTTSGTATRTTAASSGTATRTVAAGTARTPTTRPGTPTRTVALSGRIAYGVRFPGDDFRFRTIWTANIGGQGGQLIQGGQWPAFSPDGSKLAYFNLDGLVIANADGGGGGRAVVQDPDMCCLNWSKDAGWIVYTHSLNRRQPGGEIRRVKIDGVYGTILTVVPREQGGANPVYSPDGSQVAYGGCTGATCGIFVVSVDGGSPRIVTTDAGGNPHWSPRGDKIVYQAGNPRQVFIVNADGTGRKQLTTGPGIDGQPIFSRDGGYILWRSDQGGAGWAIFAMNADGSNKHKILDTPAPDPDLWPWESLSLSP